MQVLTKILSQVVNIFYHLKLNIFFKTVLTTLGVFFMPIYPAMVAVGLLIVLDTITGVIAAKKNGESIISKKFGMSVTKSLLYQLLIISAHLCETFLFTQIPFVKLSLAFLSITEFTSIAENFQKATGKKFLSFIKNYLDTKLRGLLDKDKDSTES